MHVEISNVGYEKVSTLVVAGSFNIKIESCRSDFQK